MNKHHLLSKALLCSAALAGASLLPSCVSPKEVLYIQDVSGYSKEKIQGSYQTLIQKDDQLLVGDIGERPLHVRSGIVCRRGPARRAFGYRLSKNSKFFR